MVYQSAMSLYMSNASSCRQSCLFICFHVIISLLWWRALARILKWNQENPIIRKSLISCAVIVSLDSLEAYFGFLSLLTSYISILLFFFLTLCLLCFFRHFCRWLFPIFTLAPFLLFYSIEKLTHTNRIFAHLHSI